MPIIDRRSTDAAVVMATSSLSNTENSWFTRDQAECEQHPEGHSGFHPKRNQPSPAHIGLSEGPFLILDAPNAVKRASDATRLSLIAGFVLSEKAPWHFSSPPPLL